jgi:hypothetical protein
MKNILNFTINFEIKSNIVKSKNIIEIESIKINNYLVLL